MERGLIPDPFYLQIIHITIHFGWYNSDALQVQQRKWVIGQLKERYKMRKLIVLTFLKAGRVFIKWELGG